LFNLYKVRCTDNKIDQPLAVDRQVAWW